MRSTFALSLFSLLVFGELANLTRCYTEEALSDQILSLPGISNVDFGFNQFSGYLSLPGVNGGMTKHLHYWFVESMNDPLSDPIALWTNGGPGCSGLMAFFTEQGPFRPNEKLELTLNEYAWNKISNMVFIEAPAGVGFSYSDDATEYKTGDTQVAIDNYNLIQAFFERFPEYRSNALYLTSESYGGHYIPTLAKQVVDGNANTANMPLNLKGIAIGNPYIDPYSALPAGVDTLWGHQLISKKTYQAYLDQCGATRTSTDCLTAARSVIYSIGNLNRYALDYPVCEQDESYDDGAPMSGLSMQAAWLHKQLLADDGEKREQAKERSLADTPPITYDYQPCLNDYMSSYLNNPEVKAAIHVASNITWMRCTDLLTYNTSDYRVSTAPIFNYLIDGGYNLDILIFSGDDDAVCSTIGTQKWIWDLGYEVSGTSWQVYSYNEQTAGYFTQWAGVRLGFLTIHGAGHEVPTYTPDIALDMWQRFLAGELTSG